MKTYRIIYHDPDQPQTIHNSAKDALTVATSDLGDQLGDLATVGDEIGFIIKVEEMSEEDFASLPEL